jgi:hypothetical protein
MPIATWVLETVSKDIPSKKRDQTNIHNAGCFLLVGRVSSSKRVMQL